MNEYTYSGQVAKIGGRAGGKYFTLVGDVTQYLTDEGMLRGVRAGDTLTFTTSHQAPNLAVRVTNVLAVSVAWGVLAGK